MIIDSPIISGSYAASGSLNQLGNVVISGSLTVTGSIIGTASFATTASYLSGYVSPFPFTGSAIVSGSLEVTGSANIPNITGSLLGTASFANTATSSSFATTASFSLNVPVTSSYANNATSASFATTASYLTGYISPFPYTGSAIISGSLEITGSAAVSNLQGTGVRYLVADASGSITAQSASAALKATQEFTSTAGQTTFSVTNGYATGYVDVYINGSKLSTTEFTDTSGTNIVLATGSFSGDIVEVVKYTPAAGVTNNVLRQLTTLTGSAGQTVFSASYTPGLLDIFYNGSRLSTSDYTANNGTYFTLATASAADDILDVLVYSYQVGAFNGIGGQGVTNQLAFFNTTSSISGSSALTVSGNTLVGTASYASNADTLDGSHLSILATTGSNTFTSAQYISNTSAPIGFTDTASLYTDGGLRATKTSYFSSSVYIGGDLVIFGSQSVNYITSSQLNIADNIITLNTSSPAVRFGGIAVQDSGSLATGLTGSLLWDSQNNHWIYTNPSGSSYSGGMLISGPRNTGSMGDEQGTTLNALMKGQGGDHITSSGIFEVSGSVGIGTTPSAWASPFTAIQGGTWGQHIAFQSNTADVKLGANNYYNGTNYLYYTSSQGAAQFNVAGAGGFQFNIAPTGTAGATVNFTASMVITNTGNVGIGTSSPTSKLHIINNTDGFVGRFTGGAASTVTAGIYANSTTGFASIGVQSAHQFRLFTNDTDRLTITSDGNVGIGITPSNTKFHVNATGVDQTTSAVEISVAGSGTFQRGVRMLNGGMTAGESLLYMVGRNSVSKNTGQMYFYYAGDGSNNNRLSLGLYAVDDIFNINAAGNIGINTTSPTHKLHILGTTGLPATSGTSQNGTLRLQLSGYGTVLDFGGEGPATGKQWIQATDTSNLGITYPLLLNPNGGLVGIGTTNPAGQLSGTIGLSIVNSANAALGLSNGTNHWLNYLSGTTYRIWNNSVSETMTILLNGNIGIGTSSPGFKLDITSGVPDVLRVTNTGSATGNNPTAQFLNTNGDHSWGICAEFRVGNGSGTDRSSILFSHGYDTNTWGLGFGYVDSTYFRINKDQGPYGGGWGTTIFSMDRSGNYSFAGSNVSDRRNKKDITYIEDSQLSTILKLKPASFNKRSPGKDEYSDHVHTGFIAQDVLEENIPNLVHGNEEEGYGLDYDGILALTVKALQEANVKITALEEKLERNNIN
jgi:hypothetical protein